MSFWRKLNVLLDELILLARAQRTAIEKGRDWPGPVDLYGPNGTEIRR